MIRPLVLVVLALGIGSLSANAQATLTLSEAIARARAQNRDIAGTVADARAAAARVTQSRAAFLPRIDLTESWQRSNQPVFVFSSRLSQRRFTAADFALDSLNHPAPLNAFRTGLVVEQPVFDAGTRAQLSAARIRQEIAALRTAAVDHDVALAVTRAFGRVLESMAARTSAAAAMDRARADRELAANRRDAGLATDADVLQLDVFFARSRELEIRAAADERTARAELNHLMGDDLSAAYALVRTAGTVAVDTSDIAVLEREALSREPGVRAAILEERLAGVGVADAKTGFAPRLSAAGIWDFNGASWSDRAPGWSVGLTAQLNVFRGFGDKGRLAEARELLARRSLERRQAESAARLQVVTTVARLEAARASDAVARAAIAQASESRRIIRDRYESGLADIAALLRAAELVSQAEAQQTIAEIAVLTETAALQRALGRQ
jgi:outer membrane protein TolC